MATILHFTRISFIDITGKSRQQEITGGLYSYSEHSSEVLLAIYEAV